MNILSKILLFALLGYQIKAQNIILSFDTVKYKPFVALTQDNKFKYNTNNDSLKVVELEKVILQINKYNNEYYNEKEKYRKEVIYYIRLYNKLLKDYQDYVKLVNRSMNYLTTEYKKMTKEITTNINKKK